MNLQLFLKIKKNIYMYMLVRIKFREFLSDLYDFKKLQILLHDIHKCDQYLYYLEHDVDFLVNHNSHKLQRVAQAKLHPLSDPNTKSIQRARQGHCWYSQRHSEHWSNIADVYLLAISVIYKEHTHFTALYKLNKSSMESMGR